MPAPFGPLAQFSAAVDDGEISHRLILVALGAFSTVWVTVLGAAVGSFLNVVVYRLPRGMSLVRPKSRCPGCGTSIRPGDNVPVLGWLRLRGRCRACDVKISARYPLVEATTAILFLGLAHFELFSGGANLPGGPPATDHLSFVLWYARPALIGLYVYHAVLLSILLCLSLIVWDGFPPPRLLVIAGLLIGFVSPAFVPVRPLLSGLEIAALPGSWAPFGKSHEFLPTLFPPALPEGLVGLLAGGAAGALMAAAVPKGHQCSSDRSGTISAGALIGLFLGWQAVVSCGLMVVIFALANAAGARLTRMALPITALLTASVLIQLPLWRQLNSLGTWTDRQGRSLLGHVCLQETSIVATSIIAAAAVTGAVAWLAGRLAPAAVPRAAPSTGSRCQDEASA